MIVTVAICPDCKNKVYSRARHDYRTCPCGSVSIDGGHDYTRISGNPIIKRININHSREELFDDWNQNINKLGIIKTRKKKGE